MILAATSSYRSFIIRICLVASSHPGKYPLSTRNSWLPTYSPPDRPACRYLTKRPGGDSWRARGGAAARHRGRPRVRPLGHGAGTAHVWLRIDRTHLPAKRQCAVCRAAILSGRYLLKTRAAAASTRADYNADSSAHAARHGYRTAADRLDRVGYRGVVSAACARSRTALPDAAH